MRALVLLLVATLLAGCSDSESPDEAGHEAPADSVMAEKPEWEVGQYWSYVDAAGTEFDLVVAADEGSNWLLLNSDLQNAMFDWLFDVSFLGPIQKSDLSGKQGSDKVQFFDFPLEHDKTWSTDWDGAKRTVTAHALDSGLWHLAVRVDADSPDAFAEMLYDPAIGWFDSMIFYDDNGTEQYILTLTGSGTGFTGNVHRYVSVDEAAHVANAGPGTGQATFVVGEEQELFVLASYDCGTTPGELLVGLSEPAEDGSQQPLPPLPVGNEPVWGYDYACPGGGAGTDAVLLEAIPGTWALDGAVVSGDASFDVTIFLQAYETFSF